MVRRSGRLRLSALAPLLALLMCGAVSAVHGAGTQGGNASSPGGLDLFKRGQRLLGGSADPEFLDPDAAFSVQLSRAAESELVTHWQVADGYYLYREKFRFQIPGTTGGEPAPHLPSGKIKEDPYFGPVEIYQGKFTIPVSLGDAGAATDRLSVTYQGCAEAGICYPPITKVLRIAAGSRASDPASAGALSGDGIAATLGERNFLLLLASFFGFGILLAFTPCVLPMIPILSGIIVGQGKRLTTGYAFALSLIYVLAMATVYAAAGVLAGLFGQNLQVLFQNELVLIAFSGVFVALALSMFGLYELELPASWQMRASAISQAQRGGSFGGVALMGALSAVIVGPCVAPPLAGALLYISRSGDATLGGIALFAMALGMGAPLVLIGTGAGKWLPRAGRWTETVRRVCGLVLLGVALWLLERILPAPLVLFLWGALLIGSAVYMGALDPAGATPDGWRQLGRALGLVILVYGGALIVGAAGGGHDPLRPLAHFTGGAQPPTPFVKLKGIDGLDRELRDARKEGRPAMLDFYADWCVECKQMERDTFSDPGVRSALGTFRLLQTDVTDNDLADQALLKRFELYGPPAILFFDADGEERRTFRLVGFVPPERFQAHVRQLLNPPL